MEGKGIDHQSAMDLMTGAIGRLLPKLGEFLKQEHNLQTSMKEDIESLGTQLRRMHDTALFKMPRVQQDQPDHSRDDNKHCVYELRELSYDIEDIVDNLLLSIDDGCWEPLANQDTFRETFEDVKAQVTNLAAWHADFVDKPTTSTVDPSLEYGFVQVRQFVGIHKLRAELISRMSSSSQRLKIVSIWAPGGMGKTTLAKAVYDNIKGEFDCSAFVSVGQQHMKKVLRDIIIDLYKERYNDLYETILSEWQLIDELQYFLKNKRYGLAARYLCLQFFLTIVHSKHTYNMSF
jgi:disease resistance protein RPM1